MSLKAFDETASIRVMLYSNNYIDMPPEELEQINFIKNEGYHVKYVNKVVSDIKNGSVLSTENASSMLIDNCEHSQNLVLVMNLDNKYSRL